MTKFDPYKILGVGRSAASGAIKAAYRRRVQVAHPDRGGSQDEFVIIVKAFGLLSDPDARRLYDETGLVDDDGIRHYRTDVTTILADMFDAAVASAMQAGLKLAAVNFVALMRASVEKNAAETAALSRQMEGEIAALDQLRGRITRNDNNSNLFVERLDAQIKRKSEQHAAIRRRGFILETAIVELGNYQSEVELISALQRQP